MSKYPKVTQQDLIPYPASPKVAEMINKKYGRLTIISCAGKRKKGKQETFYLNCLCECGKEVLASVGHVKGGKLSSCGCYKIDHPSRFVHGYAPLRGKREKIYHAWHSMHYRCSEKAKEQDSTRKYGEKGIKVCEGWSGNTGFVNFKEAMNPPTDKSLDRINNDLHYSCGKCDECKKNDWRLNCRWGSDDVQSNNRGNFNNWIIIDEKEMTYRQASRYLGFPEKTLQSRIVRMGWAVEKAISTPIKNNKTKRMY